MIGSRAINFSGVRRAPAGGSCFRTPLQNEAQRRSDFAVLHLQCNNHIHGSWSRMQAQRFNARKLQISCNPLRLGAAEEGVSSWQDKLESSSTEKGELLEGDHPYSEQKDSVVDEEGNIDNIEQEHTRSPREDEVGSNLWPGEAGIKEGDKGEAIVVDSVHVFPSQSRREVSPVQIEEHYKYGASESTCDEGSLSKKIAPNGYGGESVNLEKEYGAEQELGGEVFQKDDGRAPNDYLRRADLFSKSSEQFVAHSEAER